MSPGIEVFAQFGIGGLAVGLAYALARYLIKRAEEDRQELAELRAWTRDKGWGLLATMEGTMNRAVDLVEKQGQALDRQGAVIESVAERLDAVALPAPRRRPPGVRG